ncbi:MAG: EF-hand domain-containing protein [Rudaea sp.]|nr:EF-hand domain-containing protein [Rudaea sp.]
MSRNITLAVLTAMPVAVLSVCALAQNAAPTVATNSRPSFFQHMLQKMDTNGDGRISLDEYLAAATARFKSIDTKNKGSIDAVDVASSPETTQRDERVAQFMVKRMDTAGNGYVTQDEFLAAAKKRFARMDKNGDGKLTPDELAAPRWPRRQADASQASVETAKGSRGAQFAQKHFDKLDTNHDGVVSIDEYLAAATAMYQKLDSQGTGKLTAQELASSPQALKRDERRAQHEIKRLDTNGDGVVTQDEYLAAARIRFGKLDKNADGFIDADEMPAHHWAHGAKPIPSAG